MSDGINSKLVALNTEIATFYGQNGVERFTTEIASLQALISNLKLIITTAEKEVIVEQVVKITQKYQNLSLEWKEFKRINLLTSEFEKLWKIKKELINIFENQQQRHLHFLL